jgi:hypothetical protein
MFPVIASLLAAGLIKEHHAILDSGCGTGTDCLTLLSWAFVASSASTSTMITIE